MLWIAVGAAVALALTVRIVRHRNAEPSDAPTTQPANDELPTPHDYVSDCVVDPSERDNGPARIISMAPSITETCAALGLLDRLVGRTPYCHHPAAVARVPDVGGLVDPNMEMIESIHPDMILISVNAARLREQFTQMRLPFEAITDDSFDGIFAGIWRVGEITNRPRTAGTLIANLHTDLARLTSAAQTRRPRRVLIALNELPVPPRAIFVAGPDLFLSQLVERIGHINAARGLVGAKSGELSLEQIVTLDPEVILEVRADPTPEVMDGVYAAWSSLGDVRAIRDRAVRSFGTFDDLVPSPRVTIVFHQIASAMAEWR